MERVAQATGWEALGLVPYFADARLLPAEDALALEQTHGSGTFPRRQNSRRVKIAVPILPHIADFDDLDPLDGGAGGRSSTCAPGAALPGDADLVVLPGSKATIADLAVAARAGFDIDIAAHWRRGGMVLGLCGGYQMLGAAIATPPTSKVPPQRSKGSGCIDVATTLSDGKRLEPVRGIDE